MPSHNRYSARELFDTPERDWPCHDHEEFILVFDDGAELITNTYRTQVSRKLWLPHEEYKQLGIYKRHHIGNGPLSNGKIQDVQSAIVEDVHIEYGERGYNREELWRAGYYSTNRLYNDSIVEYSEYIRGSSSFDFSDLYEYPPIKEARDTAIREATKIAIEKAYDTVKLILERDPKLARNVIISDIRAGLLKMEQLLQILVVRGFNTDIDSHVYNKPILGNYFAGIHDPAEAIMESTLAAKAIIFTGAPLEQTEYGNRKMQFTSAQVDLLIMNDCGSRVMSDILITKGRFKGLDGLNYLDKQSGKFVPLRDSDTHLIDTVQSFRTPFNCAWRHHNCVCRTCYGLLAYNVPYGANIGHIASTMTQSEISQQVLKVKHSEASAASDPINISEEERPYILPGAEPNVIRLNPRVEKKGIKMLLRSGARDGVINGSKLPILRRADVKDGMSAARFSQFRDVTFEIPSESKQPVRYHVSVSRGARTAYLTEQFLKFFVNGNFKIHDDGFYHISLENWNFDNPVFELPNRHGSMKDFAAEVEGMIRSTRDSSNRHLGRLKQLAAYDDPTEALLDLYETIAVKVPVHMTHVAIVMTSMMVSKDRFGDFRIPPLGEPTRFAKYDHVISGRSMGPFFAYQGGRKLLETIESYLVVDRPQHLLDPLLSPETTC